MLLDLFDYPLIMVIVSRPAVNIRGVSITMNSYLLQERKKPSQKSKLLKAKDVYVFVSKNEKNLWR